MKISTNWLKEFVTLAPPLERIAERLTMAGLEVKRIETRPELQDTVFEVEITTNRPDWLSHLGVAREIRAVENTGLKLPPFEIPGQRAMPSGWKLDLKEGEGCPYYTACLIEGVEMRETPEWMKRRLLACGLRSINLLVDITNYVLLEMGQPLHAFDADLLRGKEVQIRRARPQETVVAIDGTTYTVTGDDLLIADRERAVAIAGVMGGRETEVSERTRNVLLESAFFHPRWVRKTALRLGLSSESSYRFERRVDPEGVDLGRERALYLFRELAGARSVSAVLKAGRKPTLAKSRVHLSLDQVKAILGMEIKPHQVHSVLTRLGLETKTENPGNWVVSIPNYRPDLERPVDLVEEVARLVGYETIPETLPERPPLDSPAHPLRGLEEKTCDFFVGIGLFETVTFSLVNPRPLESLGFDLKECVEIHNPIHQELTLLRPSFLSSLVEVLARNERMGERSVALFEVANLYSRKTKGEPPQEEKTVGILLGGEHEAGWSDTKRSLSFFDLKGILEGYSEFLGIQNFSFSPAEIPSLENGTRVGMGRETVGFLGEVGPRIRELWDLRSRAFYAEVNLEKLVLCLAKIRKFSEIPRYPAVERDISIVVDEGTKSQEIVKEVERLGKGLVKEVKPFDLFRGGRIPKGKKNLAFRITYQSPERTLVSEEIQQLQGEIAETLVKKFGAHFQL
jgi:phenylalanyl-tRNA synthetase beta chain